MSLEATTFDRERSLDEVVTAYLKEARAGRTPDPAVWLARYPELASDLADFFADRAAVERLAGPLRSVAPASLPTEVVGGYELLEEIARGGMGVVYRARHKSLNRVVALKMVLADRLASAAEVERFRREAGSAAQLDHPYIVPIYEVGEWRPGESSAAVPYFSMRLIDGGSLAEHLPRFGKDARAAARLVATAARAVHHAHQRGILHRDLKPSNILLDKDSQPHVADFGLAKRVVGDSAATDSGRITGTPSYMAPEQAAAAPVLTTAVDVYGLGAILYELLTGRPPFRTESPLDTILQARTQAPPRPRALNPKADRDLETICLKCLEKDPVRRYGSAEALADDLERWSRGEPIVARPASAWEQLAKWAKRRPGVAALLGVAAALVVAVVGVLAWGWQQSADKADAQAAARTAAEAKAAAEGKARVAAQNEAEAEKRRAEEARQRERTVQAYLALEKGTNRLDRGELVPGVLWLARGLEVAPDDAVELRRSFRTLLGGWTRDLPSLKAVLRHDGGVNSVVLSPGGKKLLTAGHDKTARLWDAATGEPLGEPLHHSEPVSGAAFHADGKSIVTVSRVEKEREFHVWRWDAETGKALAKIKSFRPALKYWLSPDGRTVAVLQARPDGAWETHLWDLATEKMVGRLQGLSFFGSFGPDGTKFLFGKLSGEPCDLFDVAKGKLVGQLVMQNAGNASTTCVAFSPDSKTAVTARENGRAQLWETATGKALGKPITHGSGPIWDAAFRPDGKELLTLGEDIAGTKELTSVQERTVRRWNATTGTTTGEPIRIGATATRVAYSPDGKTILTAGDDVRLWDAASGQLLGMPLQRGASVHAFEFTPDSRGLWAGGGDGSVRLWQLPRRKDLLHELAGHRQFAPVVAYSPDGKTLLTAGQDGTARLWDAATGRLKGDILDHGEGTVFAATFSPDGDRILTAFQPRNRKPPAETRLWDARTGKPVGEPLKHDKAIWAVAFAPDGKSFLTGGERPRLWDPATGRPLGDPLPHDGIASAVAFSRDGKMFLTASMWGVTTLNNRVVMLWETATGKPVGQPLRHEHPVIAASFSADGRTVLTVTGGSGGGEAQLWDVATTKRLGQPLRCWTGPSCAVLSPDGKTVMTLQVEDGVRLWDAATRKPIGEPLRQQARGKGIGKPLFSPDGRVILTQAGFDAQLWDASSLKPIGRPIQLEKGWDARFCGLAFGPDGRTFLSSGFDNVPRLWRIPAPLEGDAERIRLWIELTVGLELDAGGAVVQLGAKAWRERWERLQKLGGPP
jgi:eukaryotic-like serine/threonine-protein kinase